MQRKTKQLSWSQAISKKIFTKNPVNRKLSVQLLHMAEIREEFLREPFNPMFAPLRLEAYYDIVRELILAHLAKRGWECSTISALPGYVEKHFHEFKEQAKVISELFAMKTQIHVYDNKRISVYLQKNEQMLKETIAVLKAKLHEE